VDSPGVQETRGHPRLRAAAGAALRSAGAGLSPRSAAGRRRCAAVAFLAAVAVVVALVGPGLSPGALADWAASAGWWFPAAFVAVHAVVCTAPVPRTAFTVAAGVLFAPAWGVVLALAGTALAAGSAFAAGRVLGRAAVRRRLTHPAVHKVDERLRRRGWLAVGSLRMIPVVPFSVLNYCCSVSGVRPVPYLLATAIGSLPGTVAVVYFGHAVRSGPDGAALALSAAAVAAGLLGLVVDARLDRWRDRAGSPPRPVAAGPGGTAEPGVAPGTGGTALGEGARPTASER